MSKIKAVNLSYIIFLGICFLVSLYDIKMISPNLLAAILLASLLLAVSDCCEYIGNLFETLHSLPCFKLAETLKDIKKISEETESLFNDCQECSQDCKYLSRITKLKSDTDNEVQKYARHFRKCYQYVKIGHVLQQFSIVFYFLSFLILFLLVAFSKEFVVSQNISNSLTIFAFCISSLTYYLKDRYDKKIAIYKNELENYLSDTD